jgi:site-specific recombinase XerD
MRTLITAHGLTRDIEAFLRFKRAMGFRYWRAELILKGFRCFVVQRWGARKRVALEEAVKRWLARIDGRKGVTVGNEFGVVRQLCLWRRRRDPSSYVPEHALAPVKESVFVPYIFSHEEIKLMVQSASRHRGRSISAPMFRALILVLYCTGLRLGEGVRLRMQDVDLQRRTFMICDSKGRSRVVAFGEDLAHELRHYLRVRQRLVEDCGNDSSAFFLRRRAKPLTVRSASYALRRLLRQLHIKPPRGRSGARPYELRHAFAVHRLTAWALAGEDIHARLPSLSAYLGHLNVLGTEVYLKATPQLLELASSRFAEHLRHVRHRP